MKYSELISFHPIEDVIQLTSANVPDQAREYVRTYVMSDAMAGNLKTLVIDQLQMDEVIDNKGILIVGNYGTGKSHLMSVISAVAGDAGNVQYLQNKRFAKDAERIAGKFEVLRFELTGVTMPLREIVLGFIEDDFAERGIRFETPDFGKVKDNKKLMQDVMMAFHQKYPERGYLIVVDELLNFLASRTAQQLVMDLEFLRVMGEMCSRSRLRCMFGMQEKLFDNPKFSFVADTLGHVRDRITELVIAKEDTSYVVSERILKKTPEQKALIRAHLEKFSALYAGMANRMEEFVAMFPIHPSYVDVFNKVYLIENRHILKNISVTIRGIFDEQLPEDAPGIISFDDYWPRIKQTPMLRTNPDVRRVLEASEKLEDIITHAFPKAAYKPLAIKIIYALSVHRLTTNGLDVQFGLTAENLRDDLCLFLRMPEQDADFLLAVIRTTLKDIMATVSGQFIIYNETSNQYYIDVDKTVDYDEKIRQRATLLSDDDLNRSFYRVIYSCLEWDAKQYVTNFEIYERDLNWDSHNIFREGYLFMGLPGERSTAQPERDFYIHIMPPYGGNGTASPNLPDEVYFSFKSTADFKEPLSLYAAANDLAQISEGKDKDAYLSKADLLRRKLIRFLSENRNTCFDVTYKGQRRQLIEVLKGRYQRDLDFKDTIDLASSLCLDAYFTARYPDFPVMKTRITRKNMMENARQGYDYFAGRRTAPGTAMLQSFGLLEGDRIRPEGSRYASYFIGQMRKLPPRGVLNFSDLFELRFMELYEDKRFHIPFAFTAILFLAMVYGGYATMTLRDGRVITAANLDQIPKVSPADLYEFKYLARPAQMAMAELKALFELLGINPTLLDNPNTREEGVRRLLTAAQRQSNAAVLAMQHMQSGFELWGEPLAGREGMARMQQACAAVRDAFSNYAAKYNTPAKLSNFDLSCEQVDELGRQMAWVRVVGEYVSFKNECNAVVTYMAGIEYLDLGTAFKDSLEAAKASFRSIRDDISEGVSGAGAAQTVIASLTPLKEQYIERYFEEHRKKRLDINGARRRGRLQESAALANLRKLRSIEILSGAKLTAIEQDLSDLTVCYELTTSELQSHCFCPHCGLRIGDKVRNVAGQLDSLEERIDDLLAEWTRTLINTLSDPIVASQKEYLNPQQQAAIDGFLSSGTLPKRVDDHFVNSIRALLQGFEPVVIEPDDLIAKLDALGPCDVATFKGSLAAMVDAYTKGKDLAKIRIIVKKHECRAGC